MLKLYLSSAARLGHAQELASPAILIHSLSKMNQAGFIPIIPVRDRIEAELSGKKFE